jgi:hypothetical protein
VRSRKLDVMGVRWRVKFPKKLAQDTVPVLGLCDYTEQTISVATCQPPDGIRSTLLHEVLHAVQGSDHPRDQEGCVKSLERGLYAVLRAPANTWLWDFLMEGTP